MAFHEVLFPVDIALNSEGGPTRRTEIVSLVSGHEERNSPQAGSRRVFNAGYGVKSMRDIEMVIGCLLYTSPSPRDRTRSRMPSSA